MLFMAKVSYIDPEASKDASGNKDLNKTLVTHIATNGDKIREQFYRVVAIDSFQIAEYDRDVNDASCKLYFSNNLGTKRVTVNVPLAALEAITEAAHKYGHPLQGKIIDLRPENQDAIREDYKNKAGMFAYLKKQNLIVK